MHIVDVCLSSHCEALPEQVHSGRDELPAATANAYLPQDLQQGALLSSASSTLSMCCLLQQRLYVCMHQAAENAPVADVALSGTGHWVPRRHAAPRSGHVVSTQ
jgi:hypothetical protein